MPNQTAKQLTDRLEKPLESLQYLDFVTSYTKPGEATIMVTLRDNTPPSAVPDQWYQVRKKIGDIRGHAAAGRASARSSTTTSATCTASSTR